MQIMCLSQERLFITSQQKTVGERDAYQVHSRRNLLLHRHFATLRCKMLKGTCWKSLLVLITIITTSTGRTRTRKQRMLQTNSNKPNQDAGWTSGRSWPLSLSWRWSLSHAAMRTERSRSWFRQWWSDRRGISNVFFFSIQDVAS